MKNLFISLLLNGLAVYLAATLIDGVYVKGFVDAVITAGLLGVVNATLGSFIKFLTTPLRWVTLGLFTLAINTLMILFVDWILIGFQVRGFVTALIFGVLLWFLNGLIMRLFGPKKK